MEESVILSTIFFPAYVPNAAPPLVRAALPNSAAKGIKNRSIYQFELADDTYNYIDFLFFIFPCSICSIYFLLSDILTGSPSKNNIFYSNPEIFFFLTTFVCIYFLKTG